MTSLENFRYPLFMRLLLGILLVLREALRSNPHFSERERYFWMIFSALGAGIGSPLLFLASDSMIFLEASAWGLCFSIFAMFAICRYLFKRNGDGAIILAAFFASGALLSRIPFAIPLYLILFFLIVRRSLSEVSLARRIVSLLILGIPAVFGIAVQLWYNWARFSSPFISLVYQMVLPNPVKYGGEFNFFRIPISLYNLLWIRLDSLSMYPPYLLSVKPQFLTPKLYMEWSERVVPLSLSTPWILLFFASALLYAFRRRVRRDLLLCGGAFLVQTLMILSWHFLTERYTADLMPLLLFSVLVVFHHAKGFGRNFTVPAMCLLAISIVATPLTTIDYHLMAVGDTGLQKENRPLLNQIFYEPLSVASEENASSAVTLEIVPGEGISGKNCTGNEVGSVRGYQYSPAYLLPIGCKGTMFLVSDNLTMTATLSDASHECEGTGARLSILNGLGETVFATPLLSQRQPLSPLSITIPKGAYTVVFQGDGVSPPCADGVIIQPGPEVRGARP